MRLYADKNTKEIPTWFSDEGWDWVEPISYGYNDEGALRTVVVRLGRSGLIPRWPYGVAVEELDLSSRTLNSLKRAAIDKVGQVLEMNKADLLQLRNFGEISFTDLYEKLRDRDLLPNSSMEPGNRYTEEDFKEKISIRVVDSTGRTLERFSSFLKFLESLSSDYTTEDTRKLARRPEDQPMRY